MFIRSIMKNVHPCGSHFSKFDKLFNFFYIYSTPNTIDFSWSKANFITLLIDCFSYPINPAKTKRSINRFWPAKISLSSMYLKISYPNFTTLSTILIKPKSKFLLIVKKNYIFHCSIFLQYFVKIIWKISKNSIKIFKRLFFVF